MYRFTDWHEAHDFATERANAFQLNVSIRRQREYGKDGYNVSFASDVDDNRAEIVRYSE